MWAWCSGWTFKPATWNGLTLSRLVLGATGSADRHNAGETVKSSDPLGHVAASCS